MPVSSSRALDRVLLVATEFQVSELTTADQFARFTFLITTVSGEEVPFGLEAWNGTGNHVSAREKGTSHLPLCCPERHINRDGSFCLNWIDGDPRPVLDAATARQWWASLWEFLRLQLVAAKLRVWPGPARAHGDAARYQSEAERNLLSFASLAAEFERGELRTVVDHSRGRMRIALTRNGELVNRINFKDRSLTNLEMPCPCPVKKPIKACGTHAADLASLIYSLHRWHKEEQAYMCGMRSERICCCRTMTGCTLR